MDVDCGRTDRITRGHKPQAPLNMPRPSPIDTSPSISVHSHMKMGEAIPSFPRLNKIPFPNLF